MDLRKKKQLIIFTILLLSFSMFVLIFYLLSATKSKGNLLLSALNYFVDCCVIFFNKIGTFIVIEKVTLAWAGLGFLLYGLLNGLLNLFSGINKVRNLSKNIRVIRKEKFKDVTLNIFELQEIPFAFTMGFLRPEIYVSTGLWNTLNEDERRSVILHEYHHVLERDPLRVVILKFLSELFFFVPLIPVLVKKYEEAMEKSADDEIKKQGLNQLYLASALLKVQKKMGSILPVANFADLDANGLIEARVIRLIDPTREKRTGIPKKVISFTALIYIVMLITAFTIPVSFSNMRSGECLQSDAHSSCSQMTLEECRKHCEGIRKDQKR